MSLNFSNFTPKFVKTDSFLNSGLNVIVRLDRSQNFYEPLYSKKRWQYCSSVFAAHVLLFFAKLLQLRCACSSSAQCRHKAEWS